MAKPAWVDHKEEKTERTPLDEEKELLLAEEQVVHRGPTLTFFVGISSLCVIAALSLAAAHGASLYASPLDLSAGLRAYGICFCLVIVCVELEITSVARSSVVYRFWFARGFFYSYVGLSALDNHKGWKSKDLPYLLYLRCTAIAMLSLGVVYAVLGLCCCKRLKDHMIVDHRKQLAKAELRNALVAELAAELKGGGAIKQDQDT